MITIRNAIAEDLGSIVAIHMNAFQGYFLSMLGEHFLRRLYHGFMRDNDTIFLVATQDADLIGFVTGNMRPTYFFKRLLRTDWFALVLSSAPSLLRHPLFVGKKLLSALVYRGEKPHQLDEGALLSSIAVSPVFARQGVGERLLSDFCASAQQHGAVYVYLTTDSSDNDGVNRFYLQQGFTLESTFTKTGNRRMNRYILALNQH